MRNIFDHARKNSLVNFSCGLMGENPCLTDCHPSLEFTVFKGASGIYEIDGSPICFSDDEIFVMPAGIAHRLAKIGKNGWLYNLSFEIKFVWDSSLFHLKYFKLIRDIARSHNYRLNKSDPAYDEIMSFLEQIRAEFAEEKRGYEQMVKILTMSILLVLYRNYSDDSTKSDLDPKNVELIVKSIDYIDSHYAENITLESLAQKAMLSKNYYGHIFKAVNGITPWEYIISKRIDAAIVMIHNNKHLSMNDIAVKCGFNTTANFNRIFKKYTGFTPGDYRNT